MKKLTPNLIVDKIEDNLPFWVDRLGFEKTVEVPDGKRLGFVILHRGDVELMLQSRASLAKDVPAIADGAYRSALYIEVANLAPIRKALTGWPAAATERTTAYGATEIIVRDPEGNTVFFAQHTSRPRPDAGTISELICTAASTLRHFYFGALYVTTCSVPVAGVGGRRRGGLGRTMGRLFGVGAEPLWQRRRCGDDIGHRG